MKRKIGESKQHFSARLFRTRTYGAWSGWKLAARKTGAPFTLTLEELRAKVEAAVGRPCRYCGEPVTLREFSGDHNIPAAAGGTFSADNLDIICRRDNETKGRLSAIEYSVLLAAIQGFNPDSRTDVLRRLRMGSKAILSTFWVVSASLIRQQEGSMRQRREMSIQKFEQRHPTLEVCDVVPGRPEMGFYAKDRVSGLPVAFRRHDNPRRAIYDLSEACYRLAALDQMEAQGWRDANSGQTGIGLDAHHIVHRAHGRDDSQANLAGVSRRTHDAQHGQVEFTKK